jgi:glycosyltransferase involved in cell wall biosynthesis
MEMPSAKKTSGGARGYGPARASAPGFPLVTVIMPVFNAEREIERGIDEIQNQTYPNKELIVIDGNSLDKTVDTLVKRDGDVDYWISEPDAGIYDAMNKGVDAAGGEWLYFMGVDDCFYKSDTLAAFFHNQHIPDDVNLVLGNVLYPDGRLFKSRLDKTLYLKNTVHHQGAFYRRRVFDGFRYGLCEPPSVKKNFVISGDYQLNLRLFTKGVRYRYVNEIIARCGSGISLEGRFQGYREEMMIRHQYMNFFLALCFDLTTMLRYGLKQVRFL